MTEDKYGISPYDTYSSEDADGTGFFEKSAQINKHSVDTDIPENPYKVFVDVICCFHKDGRLTPRRFRWEDGHVYEIDKVLDVRRAASLKAGGVGIRYECRVQGKTTYLFYEFDRWFMERARVD